MMGTVSASTKTGSSESVSYPHRHCVDVRDMAGEGLSAHAVTNVPQLGGGVAGS